MLVRCCSRRCLSLAPSRPCSVLICPPTASSTLPRARSTSGEPAPLLKSRSKNACGDSSDGFTFVSPLVLPLCEFRRYFTTTGGSPAHPEGGAQLWERQALTRARVAFGEPGFAEEVMQAVSDGAYGLPWSPGAVDEIAAMRDRLEASRPERDLKRGPGGLVEQWQEELATKFTLPFEILTRDKLESARTGNWFLENSHAICRLDMLSRNEEIQAKLAATEAASREPGPPMRAGSPMNTSSPTAYNPATAT